MHQLQLRAAYALLLVACCCVGTPADLLPSQLTPAALVASLQDCPATSDLDRLQSSSSCAFLAAGSTVTLQPGPPANLPLHTTLIGAFNTPGDRRPTCCDPSNSAANDVFTPQRTNFNTSEGTATSLPELDLSRLSSSSLVVPPNGTLSLHNLTLTAAQLPTAPYPLPTASFLSLLAIRLSPGARLQLSSVTITTPSCVSLALHQDLACRAAPSPNFTVTPTSLLVHSHTTTSIAAHDVLLSCSGNQLLAPCTAAVVHSGTELLRAAWAWEQQRGAPPAPLYLYVQGSVQLSWLVAQGRSSSSSGGDAGDETSSGLSVWEEVQRVLPRSNALPISRGILVLAGPPDRSSVLDLSGSSSLFSIQGSASLRLQQLTLRGLPLGPPESYTEGLLRLRMWFAPMRLGVLSSTEGRQLLVRNVTVELQPEEMAFWRDARDSAYFERLVEEAYPERGGSSSVKACITDSQEVFLEQELAAVPGCSACLLARWLTGTGRRLEILDTLLVEASDAAAPLLPPWLPPAPSQQEEQQSHQQDAPQQQPLSDLSAGSLWLPPTPSTPLCALAPGPGTQEVELLNQLMFDALSIEYGWPTVASRSPPAPPPSTPPPCSWLNGEYLPPLMRQLRSLGVDGLLQPSDIAHTLEAAGVRTYGTVMGEDVQVDTRNKVIDFLSEQAVVQLPGTLLLGDPVGIRTLDVAGLPSTVVLEREPLARARNAWTNREQLVLLPFLDTVRQQRQAAGLRGLLTEPVSLTVRHLVLINLPAAGPYMRVFNRPKPPQHMALEPPESELERLLLAESPGGDGVGDVRVASGRGLRQAPQPSVDRDDSTAGTGAAGAGTAGAGAATAEADFLGGLAPSLANLTSCVWSLQLDRAAVVRAVRGKLQQGGTSSGGGAGGSSSNSGGSSSSCVRSPVDVSYVLLQSVQLVVPERELLLLAWAWATNATRHAAHPGLAEQLQLMLDGSRLAGGAGAVQQLLQGPSGSPGGSAPALPAGLRLVFDQFVWCGLLGTNVTLTSQLPGPTRLVLQLPDLDLPVLYSTDPDDVAEGGEAAAPGVTGGAPVVLALGPPPIPGAGPGDLAGAPGAPAAVGPGGQGPIGAGAGAGLPPGSGNGSVQQPGMATAGGGVGGKGRGALPHPLGLAVGLAVGCTAVLLGTCVVVVLLAQRKRAARARYKLGVERIVCCVTGAGGCSWSPGEQERANGDGSIPAAGDARSAQQQGSSHTVVSHQQQSAVQEEPMVPRVGHRSSPRVSPWVLRQMTALRLNIEAERQVVLGQVQQQQQATPHRGPSGTGREPRPLASAAPDLMPLQQRVSGGADQLGGGQLRRRSTTIDGGTASGSAASLPSKNEAGGSLRVSLCLDLSAVPSGGGSGIGATAAATETTSGLFMGALSGSNATDGSGNGGTAGGNRHSDSSSSTSSGGPPLVLLRELGRGAQGVVYGGRWRGLDVAVKSVLVQRLGGSLTGGLWHGPSLHSALSEGSISSAMSHPHVVATYAAYVQEPEGEEQVVVGEHEDELGAAGAAVGSSRGGRYSNLLHQQTAPAASALEVILSECTCELHGNGARESREGMAAMELQDEGRQGTAVPSAPAIPTPEAAQGPEQQPRRTTHPLLTEAHSGLARARSGQDYARSASTWHGVAGAPGTQVQVWKLTLVQELCMGGSLRDSLLAGRLARRGGGLWPRALHPAVALRLALHVARGSAHLHRHGVLWNDLSSANVLLQLGRRGGGTGEAPGANSSGGDDSVDFVAKVADFGLSRRLPEGATHASEATGRSGLYVAPEVVRYGRCTPASDVYAYGVLLWEVAAGVPLPELLSQPEGGAVRSWLTQQAFVPPEEAEALPAELLSWPGTGQHTGGKALTGHGSWGGTNVGGNGACLLPAAYAALAEQCLLEDPRQRPTFEDVCSRLERILNAFGGT